MAAIKSGSSSLCFSHLRSVYHSLSLFTDPFKFASFTSCIPSQFCEYVSVADCMLTTPACSRRCLLYTVVWMLELHSWGPEVRKISFDSIQLWLGLLCRLLIFSCDSWIKLGWNFCLCSLLWKHLHRNEFQLAYDGYFDGCITL